MDIPSNRSIATATARPAGPPAAATANLPMLAAPFPTLTPVLIAAIASFPVLAALLAAFAAFAAFATLAALAAPFAPFARVADFFRPAVRTVSTIEPPIKLTDRSLTACTFAAFGFGGVLASG